MSKQDDLLAKLRETIDEQGVESFHILEELVPVDQQMEFFRYLDRVRSKQETFDRNEEINLLFSPDVSIPRKKHSLVLLASIPDVKAYRSIETYHSSPAEPELQDWSSMALVSSRIILSSELSGQQQIYISSGLGGQDHKLRFFALFVSHNGHPFTDLQKEMAEREFTFQLQQAEVTIEKIEMKENYFTILMLLPFRHDIRVSFEEALNECNQYGHFLDPKYLFTNVKILNEQEIGQLLKRNDSSGNSDKNRSM